ncbi:restriction endonuclease subunit S [Synechococcus sp. CS-1329]|uniref:restriction endonuclease subunit S n=1 Tax=Synechococcus sp. CS-1329 TaxID=2847975 RepID=UPI00223AFD5C|nr:restriction endonuclease subunit S [Synechococcus sp. CS-1329]MCT0218708.1 restriction endonuclease subunit S [Synechococcus sp. CS-1329]
MIEDLKPYAEYKDSDLAWLGEIPAHWSEMRAKYFFREVDKRSESGKEVLMSVSHKTGVTPRKQNVTMFLAESTIGYKICRPGDIAINTMWAFMGALGIARQEGIVSPSYGVYRSLRTGILNSEYLDSLLRTDAYKTEYIRRSMGINSSRLRLYPDQFLQIPLLCPPPEEQEAIARFLTWATNRLDRAIRAKRRIIALLNEQKQAIIHRAVTRGLDPSVPLKDSGIQWLGEIPEHWETVRLKSLVSRVTSGSRGWSNFAAVSGVLFIRIGNLTRASLDLDFESSVRLQLPDHAIAEAARTRVQPEDILLSITAFIGSVAVVPPGIEEAYVSQHVACCRPRVGAANSRWVGYVLLSNVGRAHGQLSMYGGTKQGLSLDDVKNYLVLLPPHNEQDGLVEWIGQSTATLSTGINNAKREITLLSEYRTRLIADVVTGKLDVRQAAAGLPEEIEPQDASEPGDEIEELGLDGDEETELP